MPTCMSKCHENIKFVHDLTVNLGLFSVLKHTNVFLMPKVIILRACVNQNLIKI